MIRIRPAFGSV